MLILVLAFTLAPHALAVPLKYGNLPIYVGDPAVDYMAYETLKEIPTAGKSPVEQIRAVYDWIINHCERYEWDGVNHFDEEAVAKAAEPYAKAVQAKLDAGTAVLREELTYHYNKGDFYDFNYYVSSYARTMFIQRTGNCAHFSAMLSVMLGHLGFDCRIIGGNFINRDGSKPVHKWNCVLVGDTYYWLDVRMDHATFGRTGKIDYHYFMVTDLARWESSHEWDHEYSNTLFANGREIAALYSEIAYKNANPFEVTLTASRSGEAEGGGKYVDGDTAVFEAASASAPFKGFYDKWGNLVSTDSLYSFKVDRDSTYYALFGDDVFADIPSGAWYTEAAMTAYEKGLVTGTTPVTFEGKSPFTRAMAATLLYRMSGDAAPETPAPFADVPAGKWFSDAAAWGFEKGVILGKTEDSFAPNDRITRQEFATMAVRYLSSLGITTSEPPVGFTDSADISAYAVEPVGVASALGIIKGYPEGDFRPKAVLNRAEGATIIVRISEILSDAVQD